MTPHVEQQPGHVARLSLKFRKLARGIVGERTQIHPRAEVFASAGHHHNLHASIRRSRAQSMAKLGQQLLIERVAPLWPIERTFIPRSTL